MITNRFDIGQRVWYVHYEAHGFSVLKCLVVGIEALITSKIIEKSVLAVQYKLYPISKVDGNEYLCDELSTLESSDRRIFNEKEDAFYFLDTCVMNQRKALEDE